MSPIPAIEISVDGAQVGTAVDIVKAKITTIAKKLLEKKDEKKTAKEMLDAALMRDATYAALYTEQEKFKKNVKEHTEKLERDNEEVKDATSRHNEIKQDVKDLQEDLDAQLLVFYSSTGSTSLEIGDEKFQLVRRVRISPKQMSLFRDTEV